MNKILALVLATLLTATVLPLSASADATQDIPSNAVASGVHDSLVAALTHADLVATLQGPGPFTVFAPTDQAFINAGINLEDYDTPEENQTLGKLLLHHVVSGAVASSDLKDGMMTATMNDDYVKFGVGGGTVTVGAATVTFPDVQASNGIIHFIDTVLTPPVDIPTTAQATGIHDSLVAAVIQADLAEALGGTGPFTVFAPTDQAFIDANIDLSDYDTPEGKATLSDILLYHVVNAHVPAVNVTDCMIADTYDGHSLAFSVGDSVMVNDANITMTDVIASNGLIHVIDKVLTSPTDTPNDVPRTAQCDGDHNTLVDAVIQAELLEALQGPGPFTVFAPTDQAFADANIDLSDFDTPAGKEELARILQYHVVAGVVPAADVSDCMTASTLNDLQLAFTVDGSVMVNNATVVSTDAFASNGVIHAIDKVLTPTNTPNDVPRTAQCDGNFTTLVDAVIQAGLLETLQGTGPFTVFAPTDQAFADANIDLSNYGTPEGMDELANLLKHHVVAGEVPSSALSDCMSTHAIDGNPLSFTVKDTVMVNGATVTNPDVSTSNGVIHVIDKVLMPTDTPNDVPRTAECDGNYSSLVSAIVQAELLETLQGDGPFTVFAPTDQAFADANIDLSDYDTPEGKANLSNLLRYHVVAGSLPAANISDCMMETAVNGQPLSFSVGATVSVNGATITATDVPASNGIIHVIDKVLTPTSTPKNIPTTAGCTGSHDTLVAAVVQANLLSTLQGEGPFTVFAPTDQAFANANIDLAALDTPDGVSSLSEILLAHVVPGVVLAADLSDCATVQTANDFTMAFSIGDEAKVNGATITQTDAMASNGVIHVIDTVLSSPTVTPNDLPRTAQCTGNHASLVAALVQAELVETLQGDGPFTVFAPTDQAFADANIDLSNYDTPEGKDALANLLKYHVVPGTVLAADVENCMTATAVNGQPLSFSVSDTVMVNNAVVTATDAMASNGVIHVIDTVLTPTDTPNNIAATAGCTNVHTSLLAALVQAELAETLGGEGPFTVFAPTDDAFAAANIDLEDYDTPEGKQALRNILLYHVYNGTVNGADVTDETKLRMMNGNDAVVRLTDGTLSIESATITTGDVIASNGVIHVIDAVLTPPENVEDEPTSAGAADGEINWLLYGGIALVVIVLAGLLVARFIGRESDDLETIQPIGGTDTLAAQPDAQATAQTTTAATYGAGGTQAAAAQAYQPEAYQQAYQPVAAEPVAQSYDDSALDAFVQEDPAQAAATFQPVAQTAVDVQPAQAVAPQPVSVPEPKVVNQWTDANGHTWRVMSDGTNRWWNGTDWQKV